MSFTPLFEPKQQEYKAPTPSFAPLDLPQKEKKSFVTDWFGIQNPKTYAPDYAATLQENVRNPIGSGIETVKSYFGSIAGSAKKAFEANKELVKSRPSEVTFPQFIANTLKAGVSDAELLLSPISATFEAAQKTPLKPAADLLGAPFAVTGKVGQFAADKFTDILPITDEAKATLRPAFEETGTLLGQVLLGGKVMGVITKGKPVDKTTIEKVVAETKTEIAKQTVKPTPSFEPIATPKAPVTPKTAPEPTITPEVGIGGVTERVRPLETPIIEGEKPSGVAKSIEAKAIEANLTQGYSDLANYDPTTFKYQAEGTARLLENVEDFRSILRGEKEKPADLNGVSLIAGAEEYAKAHPELAADLMYEAANSPFTTGVSKAAQELSLARQRTPDSATAKLAEAKKARIEKAGGEERVKAKSKTVRDTFSSETKKSLLSEKESFSIDKFLNDITC